MISLKKDLIEECSTKYGDSFYLLDSDVFRENCLNLISSFQKYYEKTNIAYSYKTNYIPKLGRIVDEIGGFAEVVSEMELEIAKRVGVAPNRIVWNGPIKSEQAMELFLLSGGTVNIDTLEEFHSVCRIAESNEGKMLSIGVRCNYDIEDGVISRFGIDVDGEQLDEIFGTISKVKNIELKALQAHFAKRDYKFMRNKANGILDVYKKARDCYGLRPKYIDLGGGISGNMPEVLRKQLGFEAFSYDDYALQAAAVFADFFKGREDKPWLVLEPGTAVAASSMRYICKVATIKEIRGKTIITVNGSQKNISMAGINPPIDIIKIGTNRINCNNADIAGYTCIESDYLYRGYNGDISIGDYIVFESCGSYSVVMKPPFIFPNVPILDLSSGRIELIKSAESFENLFCTYNF